MLKKTNLGFITPAHRNGKTPKVPLTSGKVKSRQYPNKGKFVPRKTHQFFNKSRENLTENKTNSSNLINTKGSKEPNSILWQNHMGFQKKRSIEPQSLRKRSDISRNVIGSSTTPHNAQFFKSSLPSITEGVLLTNIGKGGLNNSNALRLPQEELLPEVYKL